MRDLDPPEPVRRYARAHPGELIHIDIKKLGRFERVGHRITGDRTKQSSPCRRDEGAGWEFVHVCIDDTSRIAFSQVLPDVKEESAVAFLHAAIAYDRSLGITVTRVMTDNPVLSDCHRQAVEGPVLSHFRRQVVEGGSCYNSFAFREAC
jgi:Integrase core domain